MCRKSLRGAGTPPAAPDCEGGAHIYIAGHGEGRWLRVDAIDSKYNCVICQCVLREARLTECCGQNFCDTCLEQSQSQSATCPHCRTENFRSIRNLEKIREVKEFRVRCSHHKKGCEWVGKLEDIQYHLQSDQGCSYAEIKCNNFGFKCSHSRFPLMPHQRKPRVQIECGAKMERRHLTDHQKNKCKFRLYSCEYCGYTDTYDAIAGTGHMRTKKVREEVNHYNECGHYPVKCPNNCETKTIKRKDMNSHRQTCPLEPLDCQFITVGCKSKVLCKDMDAHCQESMQAHLLMVLQANNELTERINKLEKKK